MNADAVLKSGFRIFSLLDLKLLYAVIKFANTMPSTMKITKLHTVPISRKLRLTDLAALSSTVSSKLNLTA